MRCGSVLITLLLLAGCLETPLPPQGVPNLVAPKPVTVLDEVQIGRADGESLVWNVTWRGMPVGRAQLDVDRRESGLRVESEFHTLGMAAQVRPMRHHLVSFPEREGVDGLHSALGRIRVWAQRDAKPARLRVHHKGRAYQVRLAQPVVDRIAGTETLRVQCLAESGTSEYELTIWLSDDVLRVPLQVKMRNEGKSVTAILDPTHG